MFVSVRMQFHNHVDQGSQTRGPPARGPRGHCVRPEMRFGNFHIIKI